MLSSHTRAVLQAIFVTFLWSTSWVFIKIGLEEIPALTFAGLRYGLAFLLLLPLLFRGEARRSLARLSRHDWLWLVALGLVMYTLTQGAQFLALDYLPAQTTSLILSFSPKRNASQPAMPKAICVVAEMIVNPSRPHGLLLTQNVCMQSMLS